MFFGFFFYTFSFAAAGLYFTRNRSMQSNTDEEYTISIVCQGSSILGTNVTIKVPSSSVEVAGMYQSVDIAINYKHPACGDSVEEHSLLIRDVVN
jgi:hypothetical protein